MIKNIYYDYHESEARSICDIIYKDMTFTGIAHCHPDDLDFASERTGLYIAETRAIIKVLAFQRDHEIKPALAALTHLNSNMKTSKYYNPNSYEAKMLRNQIRFWEKELAAINEEIAIERKNLNIYITEKDKIYTKLRAKNQ